ncbi:MAG: hypothetical protein QGF53_08105 [Alphaproteobacteria bacterium]|jgi:hypothetical protein|nr:hypothetical protein [Alphaproteobacteria bacterium]
MNSALKETLEALQTLPDEAQTEIVARFDDMVTRAVIDARLAEAEKQGGEIPSDEFFAWLRARYSG